MDHYQLYHRVYSENFIGQMENNQKPACIRLVPDRNKFRVVLLVQHKQNKQVESPTYRSINLITGPLKVF